MTTTLIHIAQHEWKSLLRGRWVFGYGLIFLILTDILFRFGSGGPEVLISLSNVMLLFIPLTGMIYGILYIYQSREFVELLLTQPVARKTLFWGLFMGISLPLTAAFMIGSALPLIWHGVLLQNFSSSILVLLLGGTLTLVFVILGFTLGLAFYEDRIRGFGFAIVLWLVLAVLYDGLILLLLFFLDGYPIESLVIGMTLLNPIDLARILVLLEFDVSALMGYTGAVFSRFFGSGSGKVLASGMLALWLLLPSLLAVRIFKKKDF